MGVKVTSRIVEWGAKKQADMDRSLLELATVISRDASNLAPRDTGNLIASGRIEKKGNGYAVSFGGGSVKYAKRRHYENKKNPHTKRYLEKAGDKNSKNFAKYLKGKS